MHISAFHPATQHVIDRAEARTQDVLSGKQHRRIKERVFELGIAVQKLLSKKGCILDIAEEADAQGMAWQVRQNDRLHPCSDPTV